MRTAEGWRDQLRSNARPDYDAWVMAGASSPSSRSKSPRGGPVTVTHPDINCYFMTIPEAARLVLQAAAIGQSAQVLVLDLGEQGKIVDLARDLIRMSGHSLSEIPIVFSGLRPGEKLYEELLVETDDTLPSAMPCLRVARLASPPSKFVGTDISG